MPDTREIDYVVGDVASPDVLKRAADAAESLAPLAGWVNNAAMVVDQPRLLHELTLDEVRRVLDVNLLAVLAGTQVAAGHLVVRSRGGAIVNVSSIHAERAFWGWVAYDISKAGVEAITRSAAIEYGPIGIRTNSVRPGLVAVERWHDEAANLTAAEVTDRTRRAVERYPLGRIADQAEVASAISFLLGEGASYVNGAVLTVDGGWSVLGD